MIDTELYPGALVCIPGRHGRKVFVVLGPSKVPGKIRVRAWNDRYREWQTIKVMPSCKVTRCPLFWSVRRRAADAVHPAMLDSQGAQS